MRLSLRAIRRSYRMRICPAAKGRRYTGRNKGEIQGIASLLLLPLMYVSMSYMLHLPLPNSQQCKKKCRSFVFVQFCWYCR